MSGPESGHENRLIDETSPYLLQHAHNPVAWFPWGPEALDKSRDENKPILLSIGYAACHWCHVMERESFENEEIAALMNEHFIPIKVDREERPDVDEIYMNAVQMMTGSGGWPLTVFLTPALKPFYGGTYFPPDDRWGRPGFKTVLIELARVFSDEKARIQEASDALTERLQALSITSRSSETLSRDIVGLAAGELSARFDGREGGFSPPPKFPPSGQLSLLLRQYRVSHDPEQLRMVELTLDKMAAGGLYDQLGGGFHRYSTDAQWLVPHFEKMLYDNALLVPVYLEAHQLTGRPEYARIARETLDWVIREMQADSGGYYSTQDADSEGVEGKFYVWSKEEVDALVGELAKGFGESYDVTESGNWEGNNILHLPGGLESWVAAHDTARRALLEAREQRVHPGLDDKVLTSWNGLMIVAMTRGFRILGDERFLESARRAARFIESTLYDGDRLLATYRSGRAKLNAYLDDHAFLLAGYVELFACDFETHWLEQAKRLAAALAELFVDASSGGFFFTGKDHETLIARTKSGYDGAIPSGNAMAATALLQLAELTGDNAYERLAVETLRAFQLQMERSPSGFAQMLAALDFYLADKRQVVVVGRTDAPAVREAMYELWSVYAPNVTIAQLDAAAEPSKGVPLFEGKSPGDDPDMPRLYLCKDYACQAPSDDVKRVISAL